MPVGCSFAPPGEVVVEDVGRDAPRVGVIVSGHEDVVGRERQRAVMPVFDVPHRADERGRRALLVRDGPARAVAHPGDVLVVAHRTADR